MGKCLEVALMVNRVIYCISVHKSWSPSTPSSRPAILDQMQLKASPMLQALVLFSVEGVATSADVSFLFGSSLLSHAGARLRGPFRASGKR